MKCRIGMGSNLGDRAATLEKAAQRLAQEIPHANVKAAPLVETPALLLPDSPAEWRQPFLNTVLELDWTGSPQDLLALLKKIEKELGRSEAARWAPRVIDLDILTFGDMEIAEPTLQIPHVELWNRSFVLNPLKHLDPSLKLPSHPATVLQRSRQQNLGLPLWMGVLNVTPDSFSDGGSLATEQLLEARLAAFDAAHVQILDVGAESTRPGARVLTSDEEWSRLEPAVQFLKSRYADRKIRPWISVDTYHPETTVRAIQAGADLINDVSGGRDQKVLQAVAQSSCQYVLMHSLSVPADPQVTLKSIDPVADVLAWAEASLERLSQSGVDLKRVIFDPGIGFGKTLQQSWSLIAGVERFFQLPVRLLVGHSRKSFFDLFGKKSPLERDNATLGVSLRLAAKGVDILRVHTPDIHQQAWRAFEEAE